MQGLTHYLKQILKKLWADDSKNFYYMQIFFNNRTVVYKPLNEFENYIIDSGTMAFQEVGGDIVIYNLDNVCEINLKIDKAHIGKEHLDIESGLEF